MITNDRKDTQSIKNIVLIGMMGSGKSSAGLAAANATGMRFVDTDELVREHIGMPITKYFAKYGEERFRAAEGEAINDLAGTQGYIISTGGGVVLSDSNMTYLKVGGTVVYLSATAETLAARLEGDQTRPLLKDGEPLQALTGILAEREPLYRKHADIVIDTDKLTIEQVAAMISVLVK